MSTEEAREGARARAHGSFASLECGDVAARVQRRMGEQKTSGLDQMLSLWTAQASCTLHAETDRGMQSCDCAKCNYGQA